MIRKTIKLNSEQAKSVKYSQKTLYMHEDESSVRPRLQ